MQPEREESVKMNTEDPNLFKKHTMPFFPKLALITFLAIVVAFFDIEALVPLLQLLENPNEPGGTLWTFLKTAFNAVGVEFSLTSLLVALTAMFLVGQALLYAKTVLQLKLRLQLASDLKKKLYREIISSDIDPHYTTKSGTFINALLIECENAGLALFAATELLTDVFFILIYTVLLMYISVEMTLLCLVLGISMLLIMNRILKQSTVYGRELVTNNGNINEFSRKRFNLIRLIKTSSTEDIESRQFGVCADNLRDTQYQFGKNGLSIEIIFQSIIFLIAIAILFVSIEFLNQTLPLLLVFLFILVRITTPLQDLNQRRHELAREMASFSNYDQIMTETQSVQNMKSGTRPFAKINDQILLRNVSYSYDKQNPSSRT